MLMDLTAFGCILIAGGAVAAMWMLEKKDSKSGNDKTDGSQKGNGVNKR